MLTEAAVLTRRRRTLHRQETSLPVTDTFILWTPLATYRAAKKKITAQALVRSTTLTSATTTMPMATAGHTRSLMGCAGVDALAMEITHTAMVA
jgi:hypothetical protein